MDWSQFQFACRMAAMNKGETSPKEQFINAKQSELTRAYQMEGGSSHIASIIAEYLCKLDDRALSLTLFEWYGNLSVGSFELLSKTTYNRLVYLVVMTIIFMLMYLINLNSIQPNIKQFIVTLEIPKQDIFYLFETALPAVSFIVVLLALYLTTLSVLLNKLSSIVFKKSILIRFLWIIPKSVRQELVNIDLLLLFPFKPSLNLDERFSSELAQLVERDIDKVGQLRELQRLIDVSKYRYSQRVNRLLINLQIITSALLIGGISMFLYTTYMPLFLMGEML